MEVKTTVAAILNESRKPLVIDEIEMPERLDFGQVLVQVHYSGICGAQINEIDAVKGEDKYLPHLLGHEGCATVLEVGNGVKTVKPGDTVVMHWRPSDGLQCNPAAYKWRGKKLNAGWVTTFNKHCIVSENRLTPIPGDFDRTLAPLFGCAITTATGVVNNDAGIKIGQSVVVFGVGGVGLNILQAADLVSASPIIGVDIVDTKAEWAKKFGASHFFNSTNANVDEEIRKIVGAKGADVVIDTTGVPSVIETAYKLTHPDGKTILVGVPKGSVNIYTLPLHFKKVLTGSHGGSVDPHIEIPRYVKLVNSGRMKLEGLITHKFSLDKINDAIDLVRKSAAGRVLVDMEH